MTTTPELFDEFFTSRLAVYRKADPSTTRRGSVPSCIFDEGLADVYDHANGTETRISHLVAHIRDIDWAAAFDAPPQAGDILVSPDTSKSYAVASVARFAGDTWVLEAREITRSSTP